MPLSHFRETESTRGQAVTPGLHRGHPSIQKENIYSSRPLFHRFCCNGAMHKRRPGRPTP